MIFVFSSASGKLLQEAFFWNCGEISAKTVRSWSQ
jgi:hypothetical protein